MKFRRAWRRTRVTAGGSGSDSRDVKALLIKIRDALLMHALVYEGTSSNGVDVEDGTEFGDDVSDLVCSDSGPHSWFVLAFETFGLCVDLSGTYSRASFYAALTRFEGGTTASRPRAVGEAQVNHVSNWVTPIGGTGGQYAAHVLAADDGSVRVVIESHKPGGETVFLAERVGGGTFVSVYSGPVSVGEYFTADGRDSAPGFVIHEVTGRQVVASSVGTVNEISGEHMLFPVGVFSAGRRVGYIDDMWATPSPPAASWDQVSDDCVVINGNVLPWPPEST